MIAFTKYVQNVGPSSRSKDPREAFVQTATSALQRLSGTNGSVEIPKWSVTSLEVTFDRRKEDSCIGRGGFGCIYKGDWHGIVVAVKEMHPEDAKSLDRRKIKEVLREIDIWSNLAHPHVLPFYGACLEAAQPFMVTKLCAQGSALDFLHSHPGADRISMLHEIALGMNYLHVKSVVHADLKATNVLIGDDGKALIADFGLSQFQDQVSSNASILATASNASSAGSLRWMAPEQLAGEGQPPSTKSDVYSFALTAWELYTNDVPFGRIPDALIIPKVVERRERPSRPETLINDTLWELVETCWHPEADLRPPFDVIQTRLRPLPKHSNSAFVLPRPTHLLQSPITPTKSGFMESGLLSPMQPYPPGPTTPLAQSFNSLNLAPEEPPSPSQAYGLSSLCDQLDTMPDLAQRLNLMESVLRSASTIDGRETIVRTPRLFPHMQGILDAGSSDGKESVARCLMHLASDAQGKKTILGYPGIIPSLRNLMWHGSSSAKGSAAWCIGRLAMLEEAQATLMHHSGMILALSNLLHPWSTTVEKEQAARSLACLSCNKEAADEIISSPKVVPALVECLSHGSPGAKMNIARTLANVSTSHSGRAVLLSQPRITLRLRSLLDASLDEVEQAVRCLQYLAFDRAGQTIVLADLDLVTSLHRLISHDSPSVRKHAMACCRNLSQSSYGINLIYRHDCPKQLANIVLSPPSDLKPYALAIFGYVSHHSTQINPPAGRIPIMNDRGSFMKCVHELLRHEESQKSHLACLVKLLSDNDISSISWIGWVVQQQPLVLTLAKLTKGDSKVQTDAAKFLVFLSARAPSRGPALTDVYVLDALATSLEFALAETKKAIVDYLTNMSSTATGQQDIRRHPGVLAALQELSQGRFTHPDIRSQVTQCFKNLYPDQNSKRVSLFKRIF
ncbi:hypothetical protein HGRIS_002182 [Hohenbuehelia grisea]